MFRGNGIIVVDVVEAVGILQIKFAGGKSTRKLWKLSSRTLSVNLY